MFKNTVQCAVALGKHNSLHAVNINYSNCLANLMLQSNYKFTIFLMMHAAF